LSNHSRTADDGWTPNRRRTISNPIHICIMDTSRKVMIAIAIPFVFALLAAIIWFQVWWADWVIQTLFNKDYNNWLILLTLFAFEILTPRCLSGLSSILLFLATLYIWIAL